MVMFTFLEHYDLTGKKIIPFCTNELLQYKNGGMDDEDQNSWKGS